MPIVSSVQHLHTIEELKQESDMTAESNTAADETQQALVQEFCARATELLARASSREEAFRVKEAECRKFSHTCASELVINAAGRLLDEYIRRTWDSDGAHRTHDHN
jgi:hypothetical protein